MQSQIRRGEMAEVLRRNFLWRSCKPLAQKPSCANATPLSGPGWPVVCLGCAATRGNRIRLSCYAHRHVSERGFLDGGVDCRHVSVLSYYALSKLPIVMTPAQGGDLLCPAAAGLGTWAGMLLPLWGCGTPSLQRSSGSPLWISDSSCTALTMDRVVPVIPNFPAAATLLPKNSAMQAYLLEDDKYETWRQKRVTKARSEETDHNTPHPVKEEQGNENWNKDLLWDAV